MWVLNRKTRYEIMKSIISSLDPELIRELVISYGFDDNNIEFRRKQLLDYLDEMQRCFNEHNIDLTDRQYIKVIKKNN